MNRKKLFYVLVGTTFVFISLLMITLWYWYNPTGKIKVISPERISEVQLDDISYKLSSDAEISTKPGIYNLSVKSEDSDANDFHQTILVEKDKQTEIVIVFSPKFDDSSDPELSIY